MPQTEPMTPEAFAESWATKSSVPWKYVLELMPLLRERDAKRDRAILEAAAERVCAKCANSVGTTSCKGGSCNVKNAILFAIPKMES